METPPPTDAELESRIRQQEVVADLGQQALETGDIDQLMHDASVAVADTLDVEYCTVLELLPDGDEVLLRQGVGWQSGLVGTAKVPTDMDSQAGYTLLSAEPVIVDDLERETRFSGPDLLIDHDVVSGISVVIGSVDEPWGVLGTHTEARREFTEHDANFVQSVANVLAAAVDRAETERRLRDREAQLERYRTYTDEILNAVDDMFYVVDEAGRFQRWNETLTEVTGYADAEIESMRPTEFVVESDRERLENGIAEIFETGSARVEVDVLTSDGREIPYEFVAARLENPDGNRVLAGIGRDISERTEHERALTKYETIVETINDGIYVKDEAGRFTMVNDAYAELTGYDREELIGEHASLVVDEDTIEQSKERLSELADENASSPAMEAELLTADGPRVPAEGSFAAIETDDGDREEVGVVRDITERKRRERALEESERRYRTLAENFPNGAVGVYDEELRYTLADGALLGERLPSGDRLEGNPLPEIFSDETVADLEPVFRAAVEDGITTSTTTTFGGYDWRVWATPLRNADGEISAGLSFAQDITEQVERERRLEELVDRLEASNERLEQFAYAASHDLQEPLRMVTSYLQLLEKRYADAFDEDGEEFLAYAVDGAERMREMIDGLLEYSRVETRGDSFEPTDLNEVLEHVLADLQVRIEETDAEITTADLPRVEGDASQLRQVLQNLLSNALAYSGDEPPRVHVDANRRDDEWAISVRDEGIGIAPENHDRVFTVFDRLHSREAYDGAGIGLALCERIVERHGGEIRVDSRPGEGATFSFPLPAASEDESDR
ncbi:PAS domain S-box protein [Natrinema sp. 1APR25-10V2]|uniref:PAS domain S-box protein n=1 Tax=Natrinema sp. 1APR25-10V2 TaxID=2951081 RepID=UPI0028759081|nr:PAS domain S-box protein [Natrinema sp. 1APR25-10V2]MDS0475479.1 PAS domain S-box protein [Natrinema sp. 1APR25-10V2]